MYGFYRGGEILWFTIKFTFPPQQVIFCDTFNSIIIVQYTCINSTSSRKKRGRSFASKNNFKPPCATIKRKQSTYVGKIGLIHKVGTLELASTDGRKSSQYFFLPSLQYNFNFEGFLVYCLVHSQAGLLKNRVYFATY